MKKNTVEVLGVNFINKRFDEVVEILSERIQTGEKTFVVTANPEIVMYAHEHQEYKDIVQTADLVIPDGIGVIIASKLLKNPIEERVAGYDVTVRLLELANQNSWGVYLLGGQAETNRKAVDHIRVQYPNARVVGHHHGYFNWEESRVTDEIKETNPDLVFVALGFPRQEQWIAKNLRQFSSGIFMGVGGSIDVLAGEVVRAPKIWRKLNLEWFYRLIKQPSRWRRMLALPRFILQVVKTRNKN